MACTDVLRELKTKLAQFQAFLIQLVNESKQSQTLWAADLFKHGSGDAAPPCGGLRIEDSATQAQFLSR